MATPETNRDYEQIERPYSSFLERASFALGEDIKTTEEIKDSILNNDQSSMSGSGSNGSAEKQPVNNEGSMGDLWITNLIRSTNWKSGTTGFMINGQNGNAEFNNVRVRGNIQALTGSVGGFELGADFIRDTNDSFGLSSTQTGIPNDVRLWAGSTFANRATAPFRVYEDGSIAGTGLTITQIDLPDQTTAASFHVDVAGNIWSGANVANKAVAPFKVSNLGAIESTSGTIGGNVIGATSIGSAVFVSGPLGSGWNISNTGAAEFQNITVRGIIRTSVFEKDTISAVNGIVLVSKADVLAADMTAADASTVVITGETTFVNNEVIRLKDGTDDEWMLVTDATGAPTYVVTRDLAASYGANINPIWKKGTAVVSMGVGTGTKTGYVLLDSSSAYSPYVDVYGRNSNTYNDSTLHGRFGWLQGITDADVGLNATDVWGLYTDNAYIKGTVVANSGYIGGTTGWQVTTGYIKKDTGVELTSAGMAPADYPFYAGSQYANRATAPFRVSNAGLLNATGATISGAITASSGSIGSFTIGTYLYTGTKTAYNDTNAGVHIGADGIGIANNLFTVSAAGALVATSATITGALTTGAGSSISTSYLSGTIPQANLNIADRGWSQTCTFTVSGATTVNVGAGTFTSADGTTYNISGGTTGVMTQKVFLYFRPGVLAGEDSTNYQMTTTATDAVGAGRVLIAVMQNNTSGGSEATFEVMQGQGGKNIDAASIVAGSITANEIAASTITSGKMNVSSLSSITANIGSITSGYITGVVITGGTLQTAVSGRRVVISSNYSNRIDFYDSSTLYGVLEADQSGSDGYINLFAQDGGAGVQIYTGVGASYFSAVDMLSNGGGFGTSGNASNGFNSIYGKYGGSFTVYGDGSAVDRISTDLRIENNWLPHYSGSYDLGSSTYRWRNVQISGAVYVNGVALGNQDLSSYANLYGAYFYGNITVPNIFITGTTYFGSGYSTNMSSNGSSLYYGASSYHYFLINGGQVARLGSSGLTVNGYNGIYIAGCNFIDFANYRLTMNQNKTAIVPTSQGYNALYCTESPEVWFMDFCEKKDELDPLFEEVTVEPYHYIKCEDGEYQVWGKRKGHEGYRFERKTYEEYLANERFLSMNKPQFQNTLK